jgi:hypothetical protein
MEKQKIDDNDKAVPDNLSSPLYRRDKANADFIEGYSEHFKEKSEQNRTLKNWFFGLTFGLIFAMIIVLATVSIILVAHGISDFSQSSIIISSLASTLTTIILLPWIIGSYLFPKKEDDELLKYMVNMKKEDLHQMENDMFFNKSTAQDFITDNSTSEQ